jgi:uncharacterized protein
MSSKESNQEFVQRLYAAFGKGDLATVINACSENVDWEYVGPAVVPYGGQYAGRKGVEQFFTRLGQTCEIKRFEPRDFISQGERVVVLGYEEGTSRPTGRSYQTRWVQIFTIKDNEVIRFHEYSDSYAVAMAFLAVPTPDGVVH